MKKTIACVTLLFCIVLATAQDGDNGLQQTASWQATLQQAQQLNKLIFVDCYFTGCHPCAQMDKEVFTNEMVKKELSENFVGIKVDVFKETLGDTINMKYGVSGYPTFLILDAQGRLVSMFAGFKDAGLLLGELRHAKQKVSRNELLMGFDVSNNIDYPAFYRKYYDRADRKSDPVAANAWIRQQKDLTAERVAMAIFRTGKLDVETEDFLLKNFSTYLSKYGELLVMDKISAILYSRMAQQVKNTANETAFRDFLAEKSRLFPADNWKVLNFLLGNKYYSAIAKDTMALLRFINEQPVVYAGYISALYSNMSVRKQLNDAALQLFCKWAGQAVTEESAFDMIRTSAYMHKAFNDAEGYRRFVNMAISKAKKYNVPYAGYEKMLTAN